MGSAWGWSVLFVGAGASSSGKTCCAVSFSVAEVLATGGSVWLLSVPSKALPIPPISSRATRTYGHVLFFFGCLGVRDAMEAFSFAVLFFFGVVFLPDSST